MSDKYELLRESLHELQREASARGGNNPRSQMILDLLADHEALQAGMQNLKSELTTVKKVAHRNIELLEENKNLQAECDQLRKDAERYRRLIELGEDFQWENIIRTDIEDFPSRAAAIDVAMQGRQP